LNEDYKSRNMPENSRRKTLIPVYIIVPVIVLIILGRSILSVENEVIDLIAEHRADVFILQKHETDRYGSGSDEEKTLSGDQVDTLLGGLKNVRFRRCLKKQYVVSPPGSVTWRLSVASPGQNRLPIYMIMLPNGYTEIELTVYPEDTDLTDHSEATTHEYLYLMSDGHETGSLMDEVFDLSD
ncbi:MAG: hypothetical protein IJK25_07860, partial [Firmicutes bacterium]|nr:hypothetical protein [Bacillota bacterium]